MFVQIFVQIFDQFFVHNIFAMNFRSVFRAQHVRDVFFFRTVFRENMSRSFPDTCLRKIFVKFSCFRVQLFALSWCTCSYHKHFITFPGLGSPWFHLRCPDLHDAPTSAFSFTSGCGDMRFDRRNRSVFQRDRGFFYSRGCSADSGSLNVKRAGASTRTSTRKSTRRRHTCRPAQE